MVLDASKLTMSREDRKGIMAMADARLLAGRCNWREMG
jgi:hypothetical protein